MAKDFVLRGAGLFDHVEYDELGRPIPESLVPTAGVASGDTFLKTLLIDIGGKPGSYWLSVKPEATPPNTLSIGNIGMHVEIPFGGDAHVALEIPFSSPPPGDYLLHVHLAGQWLVAVKLHVDP
jgi:hypothetical protein